MQKRIINVVIIALVWLSILIIWAVTTVDKHLSMIRPTDAVGITGSPEGGFLVTRNQYVVSVGNNEVWIISPDQQSVQVVTRDKSGQFHWSNP
ncbi:hypothetical protein JZ785_25065 [Alicyclobacillus curvatus]|nr:hypothetical protein JZ785_25065 [Alicyclobacillus curvatus]